MDRSFLLSCPCENLEVDDVEKEFVRICDACDHDLPPLHDEALPKL